MRKIIYIIPLIIAVFLMSVSCSDTFEVHEKYLQDGEIIYTSKVDSLETHPGNNRLKITGYLTNAFSVNEITVFWNKGEDSQTFSYDKSANETDFIELIIEGLEEQSYEFDVYSKDANGNKSIKITAFGTVYGESYRSNLEARAINYFKYGGDGNATLNFKPSQDLTRSTEVEFTNVSGETSVKIIAAGESNLILEQLDNTKPIKTRTFYVPTRADEAGNETSIDEFASDWLPFVLPSISSILETVEVTPVLGGVKVAWDNPNNINLKFDFEYLAYGNSTTYTVESNETNGTTTVPDMEAVEQELKVTVSDLYGNSFGPKILVVHPIAVPSRDIEPQVHLNFDNSLENVGLIAIDAVSVGAVAYDMRPGGGGAFVFNGSNDLIIPGYTGINGAGSRTVALWMKTNGANSEVVYWGANGSFSRSSFKIHRSGQIRFEYQGGGHNGATVVNDDEWHHVAYTYDGDTIKLYVDGVEDFTTSGVVLETGVAGETDVYIGSQAGSNNFTGMMDDVRIFTEVLTPEEIKNLSEMN